ncbi:MAG TPA: type I secretion system permease/ATPase [Caulobacteraceae bacterium]
MANADRADPIRDVLTANTRAFGFALAFSGAISVLAMTSSFYMLEVFDRVLTSRSQATLLLLTIIAVLGVAANGVLDSLRRRLLFRVGMRVGDALSDKVLRAMVAMNSQVGGTAYRNGMRDVEAIRGFIGGPICAALMDVPFLTLYLVILYLLHPLYLLVVVLGGGVLVAVAFITNAVTSKTLTQSLNQSLRAQTFADDGLRNADVLEGMGMSSTFVSRWRRQWLAALRLNALASERDARLGASSKAVRLLLQVALMATGAVLILQYHATGGVMIGATIIGARAVTPIEVLISSWKNIVNLRLVHARLTELINTAPKREEGMALPPPEGRLRVSGVQYVVPATRRIVVANVGFELSSGESLGVIGPSASGKSTLARLLVGAWPCTSGSVRLDGADIFAWPRSSLSRYIGYLPQDVELFGGSVRDNIARMTEGDPESVVRAARLAGAHDMILALPKGYETEIGEAGHFISGGQRQRIGIARAVFGDPRLVVLDEPNSNLDGAGEQALVATIAELKRMGVTVIVVAHRPAVLANLDKILVLAPGGGMAGFGPTSEIMPQVFQGQPPQPPATAPGAPRPPQGLVFTARPPGAPPKAGKGAAE